MSRPRDSYKLKCKDNRMKLDYRFLEHRYASDIKMCSMTILTCPTLSKVLYLSYSL